jgi:hypothetical protein
MLTLAKDRRGNLARRHEQTNPFWFLSIRGGPRFAFARIRMNRGLSLLRQLLREPGKRLPEDGVERSAFTSVG